jgi:methyl-accepting chemotaxis protein
MIGRANHAAEVTKKGAVIAEGGKELAVKATVTFNEIFKELSEVVAQINEVAHSAQILNTKNETVIDAVANMTAITEESLASTQEIAATAEEQSAMAQQVTSLSERLSTIADEMQQTAAVFQI